ncbi:GntR family transcriptional regulator [Brevibacillus daliensis]|uniref:GntR family transcriptional regulator n=1 Tax=Brevibacillus daliensis TaxID=2892995 RepID=UPI001E351F1C|nr:GntR family transcriptional regulator [Brevibacillus daliensis]
MTKMIDKKNPVPIYYQLMDILIEMMEKGQLKEHDQLPSERELCETYDVSRTTVRQAMMELEHDGYIYKQHGKGSFIAPKIVNQNLKGFYSFTEEMKKLGKTPTSIVSSFEIIGCEKKVSKQLHVEPEDPVYKITRLRLADGVPMLYEKSYVPVKFFPDFHREELEKNAMYNIFREKYQLTITKATERFAAVKTRAEEAEMLKISQDIPSMMIERTTYAQNEIIEYTVGIARGDKISFTVELE